ncbi:MAG: methionine--tRNA ligase [Acutalibacteraceae bacterium]
MTPSRYKRQSGKDVFFLTGTDSTGRRSRLRGEGRRVARRTSTAWPVRSAPSGTRSACPTTGSSTTDPQHERVVQKDFPQAVRAGRHLKGAYEGHYCKPCESFWTESQLADGCCPDCGAPVTRASEEAYFLRLSKYQDRLLEYIETHDDFIVPASRRNEMINNFLRPGLQDLCVSRSSFKWGIPVDFDGGHVIYVWIDALSNYITAIGYDPDGSSDAYKKLWPADLHVIGKDIVRFHTIYWPIILMALGEPLPRTVLGHPWLLFNRDKMSKSKGNVIYGDDLIAFFGLDAVRYYLLSELSLQNDGNISFEAVAARTNTDLANILGNLVSRTAAMIRQYFGGVVPAAGETAEADAALQTAVLGCASSAVAHYERYELADACADVISLFRHCNKYIDETTPWVLAKSEADRARLASVMANLAEAVRIGCALFTPIAPDSAAKIAALFGFASEELTTDTLDAFRFCASGCAVGACGALFARVDQKKLEEYLKQLSAGKPQDKKQEEKPAEPVPGVIGIEEFQKVALRVGQIVACEPVPKSDKLLKLSVDLGSERRQVVSGIAKFYTPESLVGKKIILVANLKPVKLRGVESNRMILASGEDEIKVVFVDDSVPNGSTVR